MDKGAVILDLPGFIVLILCHEALERQLAVGIVVEEIFLDIGPLLKESGYRNPGQSRERRKVCICDRPERGIGEFRGMSLDQGRDEETVHDARLLIVLHLRAGVLASEGISDQPEAGGIQWGTQHFCGRDGLHRRIRGAFEIAQAACEQGPARHR